MKHRFSENGNARNTNGCSALRRLNSKLQAIYLMSASEVIKVVDTELKQRHGTGKKNATTIVTYLFFSA